MDPARVIEELGVAGRLPVEAIRAAQADRETMVPAFLRTLDDFLELRGPVDPNALFFIFHLLGEWREKSAYGPLAVLLQLPRDVLETILGDCITETSHRVMAGVFDGDPEPLYEIIRDPEADEYIRTKMLQVIAMVTQRGDLPRGATAAFLRDCYAQLEPKKDCYVWSGWIDAVSWLGLTELKPLVGEAFDRGSIETEWLSFKDFEVDLQHAVDHPDAEPLYPDGDLTLFGDTVAEMSRLGLLQAEDAGQRRAEFGTVEFLWNAPSRAPAKRRTQRSLSLRQRKEIQEMLPERSGRTTIGKRAALGACRTVAA